MSKTKHSVYGPSSAAKWLNCPGSVNAEEGLVETENKFATEGSAAHHLAYMCLSENKQPTAFLGHSFPEYPNNTVDAEMAGCIQQYVSYIYELKGQREFEQEVSYEEWVPGGFGTADAIVTVDDTLHVIDLKYGKGVPVDAEKNPQGMLYALGALGERGSFQGFEMVVIHIHQPRLEHVSTWEITPDELYEWAEYAKMRAKLCTLPSAERIPGEYQCRWCKAKPTCYALAARTEHALTRQFNEIVISKPRSPEKLRDVDLRYVLNNKAMIIDWLNAVEKHVMGKVLSGEGFVGFKIVHGQSNRQWGDDKVAEKKLNEMLGEKAYNKKLLSVAQAEKVIGKENKSDISYLIVKPEGAPTFVQDTDNREAISSITSDDF